MRFVGANARLSYLRPGFREEAGRVAQCGSHNFHGGLWGNLVDGKNSSSGGLLLGIGDLDRAPL